MQPNNQKITQATYRTLFWCLLIGFTIFRLFLVNKFGLGQDEAHYLLYSRKLAWGYFDHPPMVAFLAALTTFFGDNVFFVRLGPIICTGLSLILLRFLALVLYKDERVAFWSALLLHLMPYQQALMVGLLPDATLNLFWCGTLLAVWQAMKTGRWWLWVLTGLMFGGALLSKYHAVLLALCLLGYLITSSEHRYWLRKFQPWAAVTIGLMVFAPNIVWNARHDWISYSYQLGQGSGDGLSPEDFLAAVGGQFGAWSPLIFGLLMAAGIAILRQRKISSSDRFVIWTSIPIFVFFCLAGLTTKILPHWTTVGWWTGSIAVATVVMHKISQPDKSARRWRRWSIASGATGFLMSALLYLALFQPVTQPVYTWAREVSLKLNRQFPAVKPLKPFEPRNDISNDLFGWRKIADRVEALRARMPHPENTFVFTHRFFKASQIGVYLQPDTVVTSLHRKFDQYHLWFAPPEHTGWDALFIVDHRRHLKRARRYQALFEKMDPQPEPIQILREGRLAQDLMVYKYYGFKGRFEEYP
jgi:4-amino-4-deoxy-L-arabinose transferase-like glycosyltransferase